MNIILPSIISNFFVCWAYNNKASFVDLIWIFNISFESGIYFIPLVVPDVFAKYFGNPFHKTFFSPRATLFIKGFMMSGWSYSGKHATLSGVYTGAVSGGITGCFGIPGFPLQVMYFHSSLENVELRELTFLQLWRLAYLLLYLVW